MFAGMLTGCLVGSMDRWLLVDWLAGSRADWPTDWLAGGLADWLAGWLPASLGDDDNNNGAGVAIGTILVGMPFVASGVGNISGSRNDLSNMNRRANRSSHT